MERNDTKKSSATAKTALGLAIGGLSLAAVNSSMFGGSGCGCNGGNGGLLSGLFGNNDACRVYQQQKMDVGQAAATELTMVDKYVMPMMGSICELQTKVAVNEERDKKNEVINGLLFKMADQHADNLFERAQCCCEKNQIAMANMYDRLAAQDQCNYDKLAAANQCTYDRLAADQRCGYDRLDTKIDCVSNAATARTDATFALRKAQVDAQIAQEMCGVIKGKPYLSPTQMADPYMANRNILVSKQYTPVSYCVSGYNNDCGCNGYGTYANWAW